MRPLMSGTCVFPIPPVAVFLAGHLPALNSNRTPTPNFFSLVFSGILVSVSTIPIIFDSLFDTLHFLGGSRRFIVRRRFWRSLFRLRRSRRVIVGLKLVVVFYKIEADVFVQFWLWRRAGARIGARQAGDGRCLQRSSRSYVRVSEKNRARSSSVR